MISARMSRSVRVLLTASAAIALAACASACGTERITVPKSDPTYQGAVLFSQRCSGCHTLSYAATHGSAANPRMPSTLTGPNFNIRCERPLARVLYAIEDGGYSGQYMPQNIVIGPEAIEVAQFLSKYAGRQAPPLPGQPVCASKSMGSVPPPPAPAPTAAPTSTGATPGTAHKAHHARPGSKTRRGTKTTHKAKPKPKARVRPPTGSNPA